MTEEIVTNTPDASLVICKYCTDENVKKCLKCQSPFCALHAAHFSPNFCKDCFQNLNVILGKFTKTTTDYDARTDTLEHHTSGCKQIRLDGPDWIFYTSWIHMLSDDELEQVYEFHYFVLKMIEHENELRKIVKKDRLKKAVIPIGANPLQVKAKREVKAKDMQKELEKLGLPKDVIIVMLRASGIEYKETA